MASDIYADYEVPLLRIIPLAYRMLDFGNTRKEHELTKSQILFLVELYYRGSLTMTQIAGSISSAREQATRTVAPIAAKGLVKRTELEENRKHVYIELTERGRLLVEALIREMNSELDAKLRSSLSGEERLRLTESVRTVVDLLSKVE